MILNSEDAKNSLENKLSKVPEISRYGDKADPESWRVVHSLSDIEESATLILQDLLPKLIGHEKPDDLLDTLFDIGEEFRHILYHINDPRFFSYLSEE